MVIPSVPSCQISDDNLFFGDGQTRQGCHSDGHLKLISQKQIFYENCSYKLDCFDIAREMFIFVKRSDFYEQLQYKVS